MTWRHVEDGEPVNLKVGEGETVYRALAYWPHDFDGPGMELHVAARDRTHARERIIAELRSTVVGVVHPPVVAVFDLDDELLDESRPANRE